MNNPAQGRHIASIDGLRAISVLAVIAFHYFSGFESAGYLGVDVFFVISGFVITASIANYETPTSLKSFAVEFYLRRFKRLLPALFAVVLFTSLLVMLVTTEGKDNVRTGALSIIGGANIFLYIKEADYFALTSELNPFTHMWSLAVEDQFYLLFPFLLWGCAFFSTGKQTTNTKTLLLVLTGLCAASLMAFTALFKVDYSFSFYMMPTRFWQIGIGILAYLLASKSDTYVWTGKIPVTFLIGVLIAILAFGHWYALLAHIGVTLVTAVILMTLWFSHEKRSLLNLGIPVYLGKISYSLYLWHWPLLVLAKHTIGTSPAVIVLCLGLTFVFAIASYHLIEKPFRQSKAPTDFAAKEKLFQKVLTGVIASVLVLYIGVSRYAPKKTNALSIALNIPEVPDYSRHRCHGIKALKKFDSPLEACLGEPRTDDKPRKLFLLGDSHANQFVQMISRSIENTPYQLQFINAESNQQGVSGLVSNENFVPKDFAFVQENAKPDDLLIVSFHRGRLNEKMDEHVALGTTVSLNAFTKNFINNLSPTLEALTSRNVKILFFYDTPLMASVTTTQSCAIQQKLSGDNLCKVTKIQDIHTRKRQKLAYASLHKRFSQIQFWDPSKTIYADSETHDILDRDGNYLMHDWNHISEIQASKLQPNFEKKLRKVIN